MKILYVGGTEKTSTSGHRFRALERLGHQVLALDIHQLVRGALASRWGTWFHSRTGYRFLQPLVRERLRSALSSPSIPEADLVWVNGGELLGARAIRRLRALKAPLVLYNNDDPTGKRDGNRWLSLRKAIPLYDLCAVPREPNILEYKRLGAHRVIRVWMSYDEIAHRPLEEAERDAAYSSEVAFIGTWMPERGPFLAELIERGVPLSIWGNRWRKAPEWPRLRAAWRGPGVLERDYARAVGGSRICLGLLSKGNRDLHTRRSVEVPFIGGLLCAERTSEHRMLYREGEEAVFWEDAEECARACRELLADSERRERIRRAGMRRIRELKLGNEDVCGEILQVLKEPEFAPRRPFYGT